MSTATKTEATLDQKIKEARSITGVYFVVLVILSAILAGVSIIALPAISSGPELRLVLALPPIFNLGLVVWAAWKLHSTYSSYLELLAEKRTH